MGDFHYPSILAIVIEVHNDFYKLRTKHQSTLVIHLLPICAKRNIVIIQRNVI